MKKVYLITPLLILIIFTASCKQAETKLKAEDLPDVLPASTIIDDVTDDVTETINETTADKVDVSIEKSTTDSKISYPEQEIKLQPFKYNLSDNTYDYLERDIDGDGINEKIELYFDENLYLLIDGKRYDIDADSELYQINMQRDGFIPSLYIIPKGTENSTLIVVAFSHSGADNYHEEFYTMNFSKDGNLGQYKLKGINSTLAKYSDGKITLTLPEFNIEKSIPFSVETFKEKTENYQYENEDPEQFLSGEDCYYFDSPQGFSVRDIDSDGNKELIVSTVLKRDFKLYITWVNLIYKLNGDTWTLNDLLVDSDQDDKISVNNATTLLGELLGEDIKKRLSYDGESKSTAKYEFSWTNPGKGTGAVWYVNYFTGEVYNFENNLIGNVLEINIENND